MLRMAQILTTHDDQGYQHLHVVYKLHCILCERQGGPMASVLDFSLSSPGSRPGGGTLSVRLHPGGYWRIYLRG